ncbi:hypothetical protein ACFFX1_28090 [Dactylosporangium sucinum]|uniref:Uncharacterized protein n=1 Tax=Dactylosporangium sucinum TaxID=1424081 RepID=A0A917UAM7_9ACTN|nr:hypothetical protein [Dactylosporangium sucinum]GGM71470.1 hypothetical protein GCM10007977_086650 [Dactylosporangium sucinum]
MHPVRVAFWLVISAMSLTAAQATVAAWLLVRFDARYAAGAPWTLDENLQLREVEDRLAGVLVLFAGLSLMLAGVATAVPRRSPHTRLVVGVALLLVADALLLGVVFSPDSALLADSEAQEAHLQTMLPLWYSGIQATVFCGVIIVSVLAVLRLGREAAAEYYQWHDPAASWHGFTSWLDVARGRTV